MSPVDFDECLKDSPTFRNQVRKATENIDSLENRLEQILRLCNFLVASGKQFFQDFQKFSRNFLDFREIFPCDDFLSKTFGRFENFFQEIENLFSNLFEQMSQTTLKTLSRMVKENIKQVKDQGKLFERLSSDHDVALQRHADASKSKTQICEETQKIYLATRSCFFHASIDYSQQINVLFDQQRIDLIELFLCYVNFHKAFFHQGYETFVVDAEREINQISTEIDEIRRENTRKQRSLEEIHQKQFGQQESEFFSTPPPQEMLLKKLVQLDSSTNLSNNSTDLIKEGYLFKKSHHKFRSWSRRWFFIRHGQLLYLKRSKTNSNNEISEENPAFSALFSDLRLCTVRTSNDFDRRFVFEIISPTNSHFLQAESQLECDQWISVLQTTIANLFKSNDAIKINGFTPKILSDDQSSESSTCSKFETRRRMISDKLEQVRSMSGNEKCADCNSENPEWASINLGILLCLNCSGAHRGLGVNLSKVRSLDMDSWDLETLLVMAELGNTVVNKIYESRPTRDLSKPNPATDPVSRRHFIEVKYVEKRFLSPLAPINPIRPTTRGIKRWSVVKSSSHNTSPNRETEEENSNSFRITPRNLLSRRNISATQSETTNDESNTQKWNPDIYLYESARHGQVAMMLHALALGADRNFRNENDCGRTPLIQTIRSRSIGAAEFLLSNNAKVNLTDSMGRTALHYGTQLTQKGRGPIILLLKRGADPLLKDHQGVDCFSLALETADPDVITWYRLVALREQMKNEGDEAEKSFATILDDPVYMKEIARTPSFS